MLLQCFQIPVIPVLAVTLANITDIFVPQGDQIFHCRCCDLFPITKDLIHFIIGRIPVHRYHTLILLIQLLQGLFITSADDDQSVPFPFHLIIHSVDQPVQILPSALPVIGKHRHIPYFGKNAVFIMDLTFDHPKELRKKRIRCGRIGSCHQDIDVPGFLLLCGNAFFQIPGRLVGHIIHLDSCFPYLVPESGNRTFIMGIIQNSGNRRR